MVVLVAELTSVEVVNSVEVTVGVTVFVSTTCAQVSDYAAPFHARICTSTVFVVVTAVDGLASVNVVVTGAGVCMTRQSQALVIAVVPCALANSCRHRGGNSIGPWRFSLPYLSYP